LNEMAGSRKHRKGSRKGKKGSNKGAKKKPSQEYQTENVPPDSSSEDDDFKDDESEVDLDLVDTNRVFAPRPKTADTQGFHQQEKHDEMLFSEPKFQFRTEVEVKAATESGAEVFSVAYNDDTTLVAAGCGDGAVRVYNTGGKLSATLTLPDSDLPTTAVRFRPSSVTTTKNVLLAGNANGVVSQWHVMSKTNIFSIVEEDNQVYAVEYQPGGAAFATAGRDCTIRLYDEATKTLVTSLASGRTSGSAGHSNRIYSMKFVASDPNVLVSGGWDNSVHVWDIRAGHSVGSFYGPHICGDALDVDPSGKTLITASWRPDSSLELWDLGSAQKIRNVDWQLKVAGKSRPEMLYAARFSRDGSFIVAGGCGTKDARIIDAKTFSLVDRVVFQKTGVYAVDVSLDSRQFCVAGGGVTLIDR